MAKEEKDGTGLTIGKEYRPKLKKIQDAWASGLPISVKITQRAVVEKLIDDELEKIKKRE